MKQIIKQIIIRNILKIGISYVLYVLYCRTKIKFTTSKKDFKNRFAINQSEVKIFVIEQCKFLISFITFINKCNFNDYLINIFYNSQ